MQLKELAGDHTLSITVAAMASAATDNEQVFWVATFNATVTGVKWLPSAAVTANGTNFSVLSLRNRGAAGAGTALPASRSYAATNSAAWVAEDCTLSGTAADLVIVAGDTLTVQMIHTATGVIIPAGLVRLSYRLR